MIPGKATVKRKSPEAASMSRWGQTHRWGAKSNKSMLHEWHQVTHISMLYCLLQLLSGEPEGVQGMTQPGCGLLPAQCPDD